MINEVSIKFKLLKFFIYEIFSKDYNFSFRELISISKALRFFTSCSNLIFSDTISALDVSKELKESIYVDSKTFKLNSKVRDFGI